jgi:hypothetical protein
MKSVLHTEARSVRRTTWKTVSAARHTMVLDLGTQACKTPFEFRCSSNLGETT